MPYIYVCRNLVTLPVRITESRHERTHNILPVSKLIDLHPIIKHKRYINVCLYGCLHGLHTDLHTYQYLEHYNQKYSPYEYLRFFHSYFAYLRPNSFKMYKIKLIYWFIFVFCQFSLQTFCLEQIFRIVQQDFLTLKLGTFIIPYKIYTSIRCS